MIILGIDPGTARIGWAILDSKKLQGPHAQYGCITTDPADSQEKRLLVAYKNVNTIIKKYHPDCMSVESLFFASNVKTAIAVGQARGVILLSAAAAKIPVYSYSPLSVKLAICGYGQADKAQVQRMIKQILSLPAVPQPDDTADAVAIALTHAYSYNIREKSI